jgi:DNA-binding beta-propeller fold protein YncE
LTGLLLALALLGESPKQTTLIAPPFAHDLGMHRVSKFYLDMYLGGDFQYNDPEGLAAEKMTDTLARVDDDLLTLFAVNSGSGQILYNVMLKKLGLFGRPGSGDGEFRNPHGIAVHRDGGVYVADTDNDRLVLLRYSAKGLEFVRNLGGFSHPYAVALDSRKRIYVTEQDSGRVVVADSLGQRLASWSGLEQPTAIAVIDSQSRHNYYGESFAAVIDRNGSRLSKYRLNGDFCSSVDSRAIGLASADFAYCAIDYFAGVYVTDRRNDEIHKFDRDLNFLTSFGETGTGEGQFKSPRGIAIGRQFGQVFISEAEGGQYYWTGVDAYMLGCFPGTFNEHQAGVTIALYTTETSDATIDILDRKKQVVRNLYPNETREKAGELLVVWDGRDNFGTPVPAGQYTVHAVLKPAHGASRSFLKKELNAIVRKV